MNVPIISLWQPWASLVILGEKEFETRHWTPKPNMLKPGDLLGIHAAKHMTRTEIKLCHSEPFKSTLKAHGIEWVSSELQMPRGALLGVCEVIEFVRTEVAKQQVSPLERAFGNYADGRWAWRLKVIHKYDEPIPMRGYQSIWREDVPDWNVIAPALPDAAPVQMKMF